MPSPSRLRRKNLWMTSALPQKPRRTQAKMVAPARSEDRSRIRPPTAHGLRTVIAMLRQLWRDVAA
jgi:hypothetical protein